MEVILSKISTENQLNITQNAVQHIFLNEIEHQGGVNYENNLTTLSVGVQELNSSFLGHAPTLGQAAVIKGSILIVMAVFSFLGNVATMISIKSSKKSRVHIYLLIYHLSIADLAVTFWCILGEAIWFFTVEWKFGNILCKVFKYSQMFSLHSSTFIMVLIGVDRFIVIKYPFKSVDPTSKKLCYRLIATCWILSSLLSIPQAVIFRVNKGPFLEPFYQCVTYGAYDAMWQEELYAIFSIFTMFIIPLAILIGTYVPTICVLQKNEEMIGTTNTNSRSLIGSNRRRLMHRAKMNSLRISVAIVATFIICWTPYYGMLIYSIFFNINELNGEINDLKHAIFFFGMSNSLLNPIIYGVFHLRNSKSKLRIPSKSLGLTNLNFGIGMNQRGYSHRYNSSLRGDSTRFSTTRDQSLKIINGNGHKNNGKGNGV